MKKMFLFFCLLLGVSDAIAKTPNEEVSELLEYLKTVPAEDKIYTKFFSFNSIPVDAKLRIKDKENPIKEGEEPKLVAIPMKDAALLILDFWSHSMSSGFEFTEFTPVSDTLYAVDIRRFGWTPEAWEKVSSLDPYYREPWINFELATEMRSLAGNAIVRADWFIVYTSNNARQLDKNVPFFPYYELLYANHGIPKTDKEFQKVWGFDFEKVKPLRILTGTIVDEGDSEVAKHIRQLTRSRTEVGYYWQTSDVKNMILGRDYFENLDPTIRNKDVDAGEAITNNYLGLQVYMLFDGAGNRIEFADNSVATDRTDHRDARVKTAKSCVICHPLGINFTSNKLKESLINKLRLKTADENTRDILKKFYLGDINQLVEDDQILYQRALDRCNGLDSDDNSRLFKELIEWYDYRVTDAQAAQECGVTLEEFREKITPTIGGRLGELAKGGTVPRDVWDNVENGVFGQAMLMVYGLSSEIKSKSIEVKIDEPVPVEEPVEEPQPVEPPKVTITTNKVTNLRLGEQNLAEIPANTQLEMLEENDLWYKTTFNGQNGWILKTDAIKN